MPLPKAKAVFLLINARTLHDRGMPAFAALCQSAPAYRLPYSSFEQTAAFNLSI